jgi:hypothetical protein
VKKVDFEEKSETMGPWSLTSVEFYNEVKDWFFRTYGLRIFHLVHYKRAHDAGREVSSRVSRPIDVGAPILYGRFGRYVCYLSVVFIRSYVPSPPFTSTMFTVFDMLDFIMYVYSSQTLNDLKYVS